MSETELISKVKEKLEQVRRGLKEAHLPDGMYLVNEIHHVYQTLSAAYNMMVDITINESAKEGAKNILKQMAGTTKEDAINKFIQALTPVIQGMLVTDGRALVDAMNDLPLQEKFVLTGDGTISVLSSCKVSQPPALPHWKCHKVVEAFKIEHILPFPNPGGLTTLASGEMPNHIQYRVYVGGSYLSKHNPQPGGYYVRYEDGYESYSPAEAFEGGYTRITKENIIDYLIDASKELDVAREKEFTDPIGERNDAMTFCYQGKGIFKDYPVTATEIAQEKDRETLAARKAAEFAASQCDEYEKNYAAVNELGKKVHHG